MRRRQEQNPLLIRRPLAQLCRGTFVADYIVKPLPIRIMGLGISRLFALLFPSGGHRGRAMSSVGKAAKAANQTDSASKQTNQSRPTVTNSGQVIWTTRDLLFPSGQPRATSNKAKK